MLDKAVTDAEALINAIGTVEYTPESKVKIDEARAAYDALTDTQKELVTNYTTLTDAETTYANLKAAAEAAAALAQAKTDAKAELDSYKNAADYRAAQQTELADAIAEGKNAIENAADTDAVATALANAKAAIDEIKTDAQLTDEELAAAKRTAKNELLGYKDSHDYRAAQKTELANAKNDGIAAIEAATTIEGVNTALANAKAVIDAIKTDAQLTAEETAAALAQAKTDAKAELANYKDPADYRPAQQTELTNAIDDGNDAIDGAEDIAGVNTALANAKAAIDAIKTDAQLTAEETAAALAQAKTDAKDALDSYKNADDYRAAEQADLADAITAGKEAIDAAADTDAVATALANAKAAIDAIKTDAELTAEELAQAKTNAKNALDTYVNADDYRDAQKTELANAITDGKTAIDAATTIEGVNTALANAKAAIDAIKTDAQLTAEADAETLRDWQSVTIDDQISINFILNKALHTGIQSVTITYTNQDKETKTIDVNVADLVEVEGYYKIPAIVAPAQIGDTVTIHIVDANGEHDYSTSIKDYCNALIRGNFEQKYKDLAKATLEYGQAANDYFAGTGFYDASTITTITNAVDNTNIEAAKAQNNLAITGDVSNMLAGASFMALTKPEFRFYFNNSLTDEKAVQLNENGQITTNVVGVTAMFYKNPETGAILLEVKGIKAEDMDKVITITVGDLGTITFSGNDFARMMANSSNTSVATLGTALYLYGVKAKECFA